MDRREGGRGTNRRKFQCENEENGRTVRREKWERGGGKEKVERQKGECREKIFGD